MPKKPIKILAINPGSKYSAVAVFQDTDLRDWAIKVTKGKWSKQKMIKFQSIITSLISKYRPNAIAIKSLNPSRRSENLKAIVTEIRKIAEKKGIIINEYSIEDLERFYSPEKRINKKQLAELVVAEYSTLFNELKWETNHKNEYFSRMFEAVALGAICSNELDKK